MIEWILQLTPIMKFTLTLFIFWFTCFAYTFYKDELQGLEKYLEEVEQPEKS